MKMKKVDTSISSVASVYNTDSKVAVQSVMKLSDLALMVSWNTHYISFELLFKHIKAG